MQDNQKDIDHLDAQDLQSFLSSRDAAAKRKAATRLLGRHQTQIYFWCFRFVQDHELAMDLTQEVLLTVFQKLPDYVHRARFTSWLFIIARNRCLTEVKRPTWQAALDIDPDEFQTENPGPLQNLEQEDLWRILGTHLDRQELDVLHLRCVEGIPVESISEILKIQTSSGARGVLQRARRKLKAAFASGTAFREGLGYGD